MTDELKPCPFCGSTRVRVMYSEINKAHIVFCTNCKASSNVAARKEDAIYLWNKRPEQEGMMTNHEVACLLDDLFGRDCACDYCGIDEWLPEKCDFGTLCPDKDLVGVTCWEQYLKHRDRGEG